MKDVAKKILKRLGIKIEEPYGLGFRDGLLHGLDVTVEVESSVFVMRNFKSYSYIKHKRFKDVCFFTINKTFNVNTGKHSVTGYWANMGQGAGVYHTSSEIDTLTINHEDAINWEICTESDSTTVRDKEWIQL